MKCKRILAAAMAALLLTACAENPDSDIIVHKDMDKLIDAAQQTDESKAEITDLQKFDHYTADFEDDSLLVKVHADADVDIPQTEQLSIFRVEQHDFTQEEFDTVRQALLGDTPMYDGVMMGTQTKAEMEQQIAEHRAFMEETLAEMEEGRNREIFQEEHQRALDEMQEKYENAPSEPLLVQSDGTLKNAAEQLASGQNLDYWEWQTSLGCKETVELRNQDNTAVLYVQNNPNYGNKICFRTSPVGAERYDGVTAMTDPLKPKTYSDISDPVLEHNTDLNGVKLEPMPEDSCELTREQAEEQARTFLQTITSDSFACFAGDRYAEYLQIDNSEHSYYRTCWVLRYCREIDGVLLEQSSGMKFAEDWTDGDYRKQMWPEETIELHINDAGIVSFTWNAPIAITETVVDHAALQPFETVRSTFEKMIVMTAADPHETQTDITIDRVTLSYSRISEKDRFDSGLIVPVWGFIGECQNGTYLEKRRGVQMAINAIDGSVIDSALGY